MDHLSPLARQLLIAASPQLAAISVGGVVGYPNILLEQFRSNESLIQLDLDTATWIGSTHGLAGLPSVLMPTIMQWCGRKPAFIASCLIILIGWFIIFFANTTAIIIIAEAVHGLGTNSIIIVSQLAISEMVNPKFRIVSMSIYCINQTLGMALVGIIGRYLHWKTVGYIMSVPILVAVILGIFWPESPSWLAFKGEFQKCEDAFLWLRGSDDDSKKELQALINAQKYGNGKDKNPSIGVWNRLTSKDFYIPSFQMFVCLNLFYCSGTLVLLIYAMDMIRTSTENESAAFYGMISISVIYFIGCLFNSVLLKVFNNKPVLLSSGFASAVCLLCVAVTTYLQSIGVLSRTSLLCLYFLVAFIVVNSLGIATMAFTIAAELIPVKHRDLGGALYVILVCVLHFASLKASPFLFLYFGLWGTFLLFTLNAILCTLYIWKNVPETKNRSLQEIENYYNNGCFESKYLNCEAEKLRDVQ